MNKTKLITVAVINLTGFLIMVVVNALANILPLNGVNTGQLSDLYPNLFVPAGVTFSIWGVIYLLLFMYVIYNFFAAVNRFPERQYFMLKINLLFFLTCLLNATWIFAWHYHKLYLSVGIMLLLLISLMLIYRRLEVGDIEISKRERYFVHLPFSIYLGWISVATIANITALLVAVGWPRWGLSEEFWTLTMMLVGTLLAVVMALGKRDIYYGLVIIWAYTGIIIKRIAFQSSNTLINVSFVFVGLIIAVIVYQIIRRKVY
jgi:hypothetical protein